MSTCLFVAKLTLYIEDMCGGEAVTTKLMSEWFKCAAEAVRALQSRYGKRHSCTPQDGAIFSNSPNCPFFRPHAAPCDSYLCSVVFGSERMQKLQDAREGCE